MSVHRKDSRWVVRWREEGSQRSRSFPTKRQAGEFDRAVREADRRDRDSELAELIRHRQTDDPAQLREIAAQARALADDADRRADEVEGR